MFLHIVALLLYPIGEREFPEKKLSRPHGRRSIDKTTLTKIGVGTVKTHPPGIRTPGPLFSFSAIEDKLVTVVKRPPVIGPTIVGLPGQVAALKKQVARAVVAHDEDHVTLQAVLLGSEFALIDAFHLLGGELAQIHAAQPVVGNLKFYRRFPLAFAQAILADRRIGLDLALYRIEFLHGTPAGAAIVTR